MLGINAPGFFSFPKPSTKTPGLCVLESKPTAGAVVRSSAVEQRAYRRDGCDHCGRIGRLIQAIVATVGTCPDLSPDRHWKSWKHFLLECPRIAVNIYPSRGQVRVVINRLISHSSSRTYELPASHRNKKSYFFHRR
jgi:hypothetical protein